MSWTNASFRLPKSNKFVLVRFEGTVLLARFDKKRKQFLDKMGVACNAELEKIQWHKVVPARNDSEEEE